MLLYLDSNIVQYCADYADCIFGDNPLPRSAGGRLREELRALRQLMYIEQFGSWMFASPELLLVELHRGRPTSGQQETYAMLEDAFDPEVAPDVRIYEETLTEPNVRNLRHHADRRHIAAAAAMGASWFLTNDREIVRKLSAQPVHGMKVRRPSTCVDDILVGLFLQ